MTASETSSRPWLRVRGPQAAWYYGPFFRLLNSAPVDAISFINRMLDHAARFRVKSLFGHGSEVGTADEPDGIDLDLPGLGTR